VTAWIHACRLLVPFRARTPDRERPILKHQALHATELTRIVRHQPQGEASRVRGNEEIVGANHLAALLQIGRGRLLQ
jgi:hypothetical protein